MADAQWPAYGEALLDENLVSGRPGEIINYRLFYTDTQSKKELIRFDEKISEPLRDRIKAFYSGHFGFGQVNRMKPKLRNSIIIMIFLFHSWTLRLETLWII